MRVLVTGGRDFDDQKAVDSILDLLREDDGVDLIIHGNARGVDSLCGNWAWRNAVKVLQFRADWDTHGKAAGPIRNQQMLTEGKPDILVAFPGGRGTEDMKRRARKAGLRVMETTA